MLTSPPDPGYLRPGDRWKDETRDGEWLVVLTDDGPRLKFCDDRQPPPPTAQPREMSYVLDHYGSITLVQRQGRTTGFTQFTVTAPAPPLPSRTDPGRHGLPRGHRW